MDQNKSQEPLAPTQRYAAIMRAYMTRLYPGPRSRPYAGLLSILVLTMTAIVHPANCFAYRPFATEDAGVAGKGVAQVEISWDYLKWDQGDAESVLLFVPIYGLTRRIELSLEIPYMFHNPKKGGSHEGIGDINIVGKFLVVEESNNIPAFTAKGVVKTNSGDEKKDLGSGAWDYSIIVVASKNIQDLTLHSMFGYTFTGRNGNKSVSNIYLYGFAADYGLTKALHVVAEVSGYRHPDRKVKTNPISGLLGATYRVSEKVTLDCGIRLGFNKTVPDWNTTLGMSIGF